MPTAPPKRPQGLRRLRHGLALSALCLATASPGVTILDSTWRAEGGRRGDVERGFRAHMALAAQPPFRGVLALSTDGESWGEASGTWIGNDARHAYILTAGHVFELPAQADEYRVRGPRGEVWRPDRVWVHPQWNGEVDSRAGYDLAILRLPFPVEGLGPAPVLYTGRAEAGQLITFVGYGTRGTGTTGENEKVDTRGTAAAAQGVVDEWVDLKRKVDRPSHDRGNTLGVFMPKEDGSIENPYGGSSRPVTRLVGLLGSGDSGGSAWMETEEGWVLVGVNSNGDGDAGYGDSSWFTRVSPHQGWVRGIFPGARFSGAPPLKGGGRFAQGSGGGTGSAPVPASPSPASRPPKRPIMVGDPVTD